ncbi:DNA-methyltransferase [Natronincola ferrireducens]|uniref:Methyltransferase n=1 Tax=Natronincola ferrireducens TaxID=393762 RepID=A0A1G9IEE8_9FIRM|nr:site-specific DNA-methyltransferase [Natronincola ferrireducens]SDL23611.1 site-specific DNA-methyltransferase (adenine-specific) [Natronincola ferrireducens]
MKWNFNKVYLGDADNLLKQMLEDGLKFDLILTDPPYNLGKDFGNDSDKLSLDEFLRLSKHRITLCRDLLHNNGSILWFGIHHYIAFIQVIMYELGLYYRRMNIWHYENGFSRTRKTPLTQYEPFLWFSRSKNKWTYNVDDVRMPYKSSERLKNPVKYKNSKGEVKIWKPNPNGAMRGDVWKFPTLAGKAFENEKTKHPTQKPEMLIRELIKAFCPKNKDGIYEGYILDPFHGSGTLGVCCEKLNQEGHNIKWIGIEIQKEYAEIANKRIEEINR